MSKKFKRFLVIGASCMLALQLAGVLLLGAQLLLTDSVHSMVDTIMSDQLFSTLMDSCVRANWLSIDVDKKEGVCEFKVTPDCCSKKQKAVLHLDNTQYEMAWSKDEYTFVAQITLPLDLKIQEARLTLEQDDQIRTEYLYSGGEPKTVLGLFTNDLSPFEDCCSGDNMFDYELDYSNATYRDNESFRFRSNFSLSEYNTLPLNGVFKSGKIYILEAETGKTLYSVPLDQNGVAEVVVTLPTGTRVEMRAEVLCEDGMTYDYGIWTGYWEYTPEMEWGDYDYFIDTYYEEIIAIFPDATELVIRTVY